MATKIISDQRAMEFIEVLKKAVKDELIIGYEFGALAQNPHLYPDGLENSVMRGPLSVEEIRDLLNWMQQRAHTTPRS